MASARQTVVMKTNATASFAIAKTLPFGRTIQACIIDDEAYHGLAYCL